MNVLLSVQTPVNRVAVKPFVIQADTLSASHSVSRPACDFPQCAPSLVSISIPRSECEWGRCTVPPWDYRSVLYAFPLSPLLTAALGWIRESTHLFCCWLWRGPNSLGAAPCWNYRWLMRFAYLSSSFPCFRGTGSTRGQRCTTFTVGHSAGGI